MQASVDHLSNTLGEFSVELEPSEQSHIPAYIRKFQLSQTVPTVERFESTGDDPLTMSDVAALTGIGPVSYTHLTLPTKRIV